MTRPGPRFLAVFALVALIALPGCTGTARTPGAWGVPVDVTTYNRAGEAPALAGRKTAVLALGEQTSSLEFLHISERLSRELAEKNAVIVDRTRKPEVVVTLAATAGSPMIVPCPDADRRSFGYDNALYPTLWPGTNFSYGFSPLGYRRQGWREPYYGFGVHGVYRQSCTRTLHDITLRLRFYDARRLGGRAPENEMPDSEVVATVRSPSSSLTDALPSLITAAVSVYPGADGQLHRVEVLPRDTLAPVHSITTGSPPAPPRSGIPADPGAPQPAGGR